MKLKIILIASGYCLIIGGSTFFLSWEHGLGVAALLATIHSMVAFLKKHGEVIELPATPKQPSSKKQKKPPSSKENIAELAGFNKDIFQQFQNHLQEHSNTLPAQADSLPKQSKPLAQKTLKKQSHPYSQILSHSEPPLSFNESLELNQEDKVHLTQKKQNQAPAKKEALLAKNKAPTPSKTAPPPPHTSQTKPFADPKQTEKAPAVGKVDQNEKLLQTLSQPLEEVSDDLFADVQIPLSSEQSLSPENPPPHKTTDLFDEGLGDSLQANNSHEENTAEAIALLKMAQGSFQAGHISEAKAGLDNFFAIQQELGETPNWEVQYLYAQICLRLGDQESAKVAFSQMTQQGLETTHPDYSNMLEAISASLEEHKMYQEALPFLHDLLNYYRQQLLDRVQMDRVYERIERALEALGEDERLTRTYKNHLEIKRILKDQDGESRLLDALGNRYYKMGDKALSRKYYEENLHLKALMNKVESS